MKLFIRTLILLISIQLIGVSEEPPTPKSTESSETRITQSNLTSVPNAFVGMVNVITGDLVDQEIDQVIPGPNPIIIERSYSSSFASEGTLEYAWDLNHSMRVGCPALSSFGIQRFRTPSEAL
ncbi:MAG: hypothetical protein CK425_11840 [Parachlamydia sp.]|nr:MAG: hypothetical protein CK425_11840 [Parachlamydia sp.]